MYVQFGNVQGLGLASAFNGEMRLHNRSPFIHANADGNFHVSRNNVWYRFPLQLPYLNLAHHYANRGRGGKTKRKIRRKEKEEKEAKNEEDGGGGREREGK